MVSLIQEKICNLLQLQVSCTDIYTSQTDYEVEKNTTQLKEFFWESHIKTK